MSNLPKIYRLFLSVIRVLLQDHPPTARAVTKTPSFRTFAARMWAVFLAEPTITDDFAQPEEISGGRVGNFPMFCAYTTAAPNVLSVTEEAHLQEFIEGAGGTKSLLVALIVKHHECVRDVGCTADPRCTICDLSVHFNYVSPSTAIPYGVSVGRLGDLAAIVTVWADYFSRARRSAGRKRIHVMHVPDGADSTSWIFPLRSATEALALEVERLAPETGGKVDQDVVRRLVENGGEEIHGI
ncbi:hypothetical protein B0H16DRAFT_1717326 [Mycena metata]|uniref:Uncharacterized protein n=1 Tax=Mycena metata TaxID=1033252 RepID=A0AAD7NLM5_9AGAR|nr:hypothetical protein B0H16DRAFT_1717326 [Mycena metata]